MYVSTVTDKLRLAMTKLLNEADNYNGNSQMQPPFLQPKELEGADYINLAATNI